MEVVKGRRDEREAFLLVGVGAYMRPGTALGLEGDLSKIVQASIESALRNDEQN